MRMRPAAAGHATGKAAEEVVARARKDSEREGEGTTSSLTLGEQFIAASLPPEAPAASRSDFGKQPAYSHFLRQRNLGSSRSAAAPDESKTAAETEAQVDVAKAQSSCAAGNHASDTARSREQSPLRCLGCSKMEDLE